MVGETMRSDLCIYGRWAQNMKAMKGDGSKGMEGKRCVYGQWIIDITLSLIACEIIGIRTLNRGVIILFFIFLFLMKGKRVNS